MTKSSTIPVPTQVAVSAPDPFRKVPGVLYCVFDDHGNVVQTTGSWQDVLGYSEDEARSIAVEEIVHPDERANPAVGRSWIGRTPIIDGKVLRFRHKDGSYKSLLWRVGSLGDTGEVHAVAVELPVSGVPTSVEDLSEQQRAREQLQQNNDLLEQRVAERTQQLVAANTELEAFCFSVSHDLRAPLRAIDGFTYSVMKQYGTLMGEDGRADLERVRRASHRMSELIDALLGLARLTRQEVRWQVVDLSATARQICEELQAEHPDRIVQCEIQDGMEVRADARLLHLLLHNLFANAWKFSSNVPDAQVRFQAQATGAEVIYSITDNGAGFDMAYADKLFQPFQRLHHPSEYPGNGVGLATVNRIVNRHGGRTFAHGMVNRGATIYFTLAPNGQE